MPLVLSINPHGRLFVEESRADGATPLDAGPARRVMAAFAESTARGLLHLATAELQTHLPTGFAFARDFGREYLTRLCHAPGRDDSTQPAPGPLSPPQGDELAATALRGPPM